MEKAEAVFSALAYDCSRCGHGVINELRADQWDNIRAMFFFAPGWMEGEVASNFLYCGRCGSRELIDRRTGERRIY